MKISHNKINSESIQNINFNSYEVNNPIINEDNNNYFEYDELNSNKHLNIINSSNQARSKSNDIYIKYNGKSQLNQIENGNNRKKDKTENVINYIIKNKSYIYKIIFKIIFFIFLSCVFLYIVLVCFIIHENKGKESSFFKYNIDQKDTYSINEIKDMKKVVYTVIVGKYEKIRKIDKQEGWDYYAFIEPYPNKNKSGNWTILKVPEFIKNLPVKEVKKQRYIKTHPHLFFQNYSLSLYIDGNINITGNLSEFIMRILKPKYNIFMVEHPERGSINEEFKEVVRLKKDTQRMADIVKEHCQKENYPDDIGLAETNVMVRRHNQNETIELMENWWNEIYKYSHRDQLSFNLVLWKSRIKIKYISKFLLNDYFHFFICHLN